MPTSEDVKNKISAKLNRWPKSENDVLIFFNTFINYGAGDKRKSTLPFINWYNNIVLNQEPFNFKQFNYQWRLHLSDTFCNALGDYHSIKNEIKNNRDIQEFYNNHCINNTRLGSTRHESSFCSKIFHTFIPNEFPPVDSYVRKSFGFNINKSWGIDEIEIIKDGYNLYNKEYPATINLIKNVLSNNEHLNQILRPNELSNVRIIDMCFWSPQNN